MIKNNFIESYSYRALEECLFIRPGGATVARLTPDQKVACSNHVRVTFFLQYFFSSLPCSIRNFSFSYILFASNQTQGYTYLLLNDLLSIILYNCLRESPPVPSHPSELLF